MDGCKCTSVMYCLHVTINIYLSACHFQAVHSVHQKVEIIDEDLKKERVCEDQ